MVQEAVKQLYYIERMINCLNVIITVMKNLFPCFFKVRRKIIKKNKSTDAQAKKKDRSFGRDISNLPVDKEKCKPINLP